MNVWREFCDRRRLHRVLRLPGVEGQCRGHEGEEDVHELRLGRESMVGGRVRRGRHSDPVFAADDQTFAESCNQKLQL